MFRDVNVQDAPPIMTDDEEAVEHAERNRWHREEVHCRDRLSMVLEKSTRLAGSESLGACFIQREIVRSEMSKPSMSSSLWMRGAPQVVFSATIRKMACLTLVAEGSCGPSERVWW